MNEEQKKQFLDMDLYKLFEVEETATIEQIRKAYRKRALESHPDKNQDNKEAAEKKFVLLGKALEILATGSSKAAYDAVRKARREKAKRDEMLDGKRKKLKDALEEREKWARDKAEKQTEQMKRSNAEERYQKEVDRLRNEGKIINWIDTKLLIPLRIQLRISNLFTVIPFTSTQKVGQSLGNLYYWH